MNRSQLRRCWRQLYVVVFVLSNVFALWRRWIWG